MTVKGRRDGEKREQERINERGGGEERSRVKRESGERERCHSA